MKLKIAWLSELGSICAVNERVQRGEVQTLNSNAIVESILNNTNEELAVRLDAHVLLLKAPMLGGVDDAVRSAVEAINADAANTKAKLVVVLETTGGYIEVVERIYAVFRRHYATVDFIIPNHAYSAGTVLALSGDAIYMDYYSVLGPIDPQFQNEAGELVPGMGYLAKYRELLSDINSAAPGEAKDAQIAYLLKKFDPAKLFQIEQAAAHAVSLLKDWLPKHKFKEWLVTETGGAAVTPDMREERAKNIAEILGDPERWNSHGRGIGLRDLESDEIKLKVTDFGADPDLSRNVRSYYELFLDFCGKTGAGSALHTASGFRRIG